MPPKQGKRSERVKVLKKDGDKKFIKKRTDALRPMLAVLAVSTSWVWSHILARGTSWLWSYYRSLVRHTMPATGTGKKPPAAGVHWSSWADGQLARCSACLQMARHSLRDRRRLGRSIFECGECQARTLPCRMNCGADRLSAVAFVIGEGT